MKRTRRNHGATVKAQVALAAVKGGKTLAEWAEQFLVHPRRSLKGSSHYGRGPRKSWRDQQTADRPDLKTLHA